MMAKPRDPQEMRYAELTRFITALERSGGDANVLRVERALKIAIPVTCLIIALFGAPLATSTQRGGTAYGIGVSLATTVIFLMLIQLTQGHRREGVIAPDLAAWIPERALRRDRTRAARARAHVSESDRRRVDMRETETVPGRPARRRSGFSGASRAASSRFFRAHRRARRTSSATSAARFGDPATYVPETIRQMQEHRRRLDAAHRDRRRVHRRRHRASRRATSSFPASSSRSSGSPRA